MTAVIFLYFALHCCPMLKSVRNIKMKVHLVLAAFIIGFAITSSAGFASLNTFAGANNASVLNETFISRALLSTQVCQPGFGSTVRGTALCELCASGFYSSGGIGSKCLVCDQFSYAVSSGSSSCTQCPPNQWVGSKGSASPICVCMKNFYFAFYRDASLKGQMPPTPTDIAQTLSTFSTPSEKFCLPCPFGANCLGNFDMPRPDRGYWANQSDPVSIVFCTWNKEACLGDFKCLPSHSGPLCGRCERDYFMRTGTCSRCSLSSRIIILYIILVGIFGGLVFGWLVKVQSTFVIISSVQYFQVLTILNRYFECACATALRSRLSLLLPELESHGQIILPLSLKLYRPSTSTPVCCSWSATTPASTTIIKTSSS